MATVIECVPNFSEGRRKGVVDKIVHSVRSVPGVKVLDVEMDPDHNRSVVTFAGGKDAVAESAFRAARAASQLIDLSTHRGEHPRMGALDVLPFVPISGATMEDCVKLANDVGERIGTELGIPVYLYEAAAKCPERIHLEDVRRGQYEGLKEAILTDVSRYPDYGPRKVHPRAGAVAVGARMPLIAFNVNLRSQDVEVAKAIAKAIRASSGGFPHVKALGFSLKEKEMVQVSMNLTDYTVTPISKVFQDIKDRAKAMDVEIAESEIIGLIPLDAVVDLAAKYLMINNLTSQQVLERRIWS